MKKREYPKDLVVYQAKSGAIELRADVAHETIWATQAQITKLFGVDRTVITRHIRNVIRDGEIDEKSNVQKVHIATSDRPVSLYSLDVVLSVGYRTNSKAAVAFRRWATKTLREHITKGYTINRRQIAKNYDAFMKAVADIQSLLPDHVTLDPKQILELIKEFSATWVSLDAYDRETLKPIGATKKTVELSNAELKTAIANLRAELIVKGEASDLFAHEQRPGGIEGIIGNVMQSFGGKPLYETVEEQAAHILYFMVKNHPFTDGNKRCGAFAFVWFLRKAGIRGTKKISPIGLTVLTLLTAESAPEKKDQMVALITHLLR